MYRSASLVVDACCNQFCAFGPDTMVGFLISIWQMSFQSGICLFPSGVVKPSTSITAFVINAPLQNVGFLIFQRWVFNFGTLGFLFVFFIRQSALQPFTRNKKSETISNTHWLTLFLRCCNYKHTSVDLIRLFCAVPATHTPRKRRNRPLMATRRQTPSELSQTPSEFTICTESTASFRSPDIPSTAAAFHSPGAGGAGGGGGRHVQRAERGKHTVGVCDDGAGCGSPGRT